MNLLKIFTFLIFVFAPYQKEYVGIVHWVIDGDTFLLATDNDEIKVRPDGIDCPEKDQPYGTEARKYLERYWGKRCKVVWTKKDRYGRVLGTLWVDSVNVNLELVRNGLASHYKKYSKDTTLAQAEVDAKAKKLGLWADDKAIAPWVWREKSD